MSEAKRVVDWDLVEVEYRAGVKSLKAIGAEFGVSDAGILKRAKRDGWTRDLAAKIKAKADAKVSAAAVSAEVSVARTANEQQVVEANSEAQAGIRLEHRKDIGRTRALFRALLEEIEVATSIEGRALIGELAQVMSPAKGGESEEEQDRRIARMNRLLEKVTGGPARIDSAKKLTEMLEKLVKLERQAFGIDDEDKGGSELDRLLQKIHAERTGS